MNAKINRSVWMDIPVADLDRANAFYEAVLGVGVSREEFDGTAFSVIEHEDGNGGCLVVDPEAIAGKRGILVYMNADGRIREATEKAAELGGEIIQPVHQIGPHGFRSIVMDSEGNRIALHSESDA